MPQNYIIHSYQDTLYSCLMPHAKQFEYRMPNHAIIYVRTGRFTVEQDGIATDVEAGNYVFVRRNCMAKITKQSDGDKPYTGINLTLRREVLKDYYSSLNREKTPRGFSAIKEAAKILPKTIELDSLFSSFAAYVDNNQEPLPELLEMKVKEAVMALLLVSPEFYPTLFDFNEMWKVDLIEFLEQNFTEDLTLSEFASYTGRSLATFKRDFAKVSDISPQQWINEHRLELAHQLLTLGKAGASDVCYQVGFKNRSHFSTAFKKRFGVPPSQCYLSSNNHQ